MTVLRLLTRREEERWTLPIDREREREREAAGLPQSTRQALSFAFAVGLAATLLGMLVSIVVPGRGFLAVWALVTLAVSVAAGWEADRVRAAARRVLLNHLSRTR